jgi:preprotein translocase subunit SecD
MSEKLSGFGRRLAANVAVLIGAIVLGWIALKIVKGFIVTLIIGALAIFALYVFFWGWGARKR